VHFYGCSAKFGTDGHPNWNAHKHVTNMRTIYRKIPNCWNHDSLYKCVSQKGFEFEFSPRQAETSAHIQYISAHIQYISAHIQYISAHIQYIPAHIQYIPAHIQYISAHIQYISAHIQYISAHIQYISAHAVTEQPNVYTYA
jgi:hypothetical protein